MSSEKRKLHLVTQDGQPYGSTRHCCELCGELVHGNSNFYAEDRETFKQAVESGDFVRCDSKDGE